MNTKSMRTTPSSARFCVESTSLMKRNPHGPIAAPVLPPVWTEPPVAELAPEPVAPPDFADPPVATLPPEAELPPELVVPPDCAEPPVATVPPVGDAPPEPVTPPDGAEPPVLVTPPDALVPPEPLAPPVAEDPPLPVVPPVCAEPPELVTPPDAELPPEPLGAGDDEPQPPSAVARRKQPSSPRVRSLPALTAAQRRGKDWKPSQGFHENDGCRMVMPLKSDSGRLIGASQRGAFVSACARARIAVFDESVRARIVGA